MFYGKGAGKLPTASAVVADVIDCVKHFKARKYLFWEDARENYVAPYEDVEESVFLRVRGDNDSDVTFHKVERAFPELERVIRKDEEPGEIGFVLNGVTERRLQEEVLPLLEKAGLTVENHIRIADFDQEEL